MPLRKKSSGVIFRQPVTEPLQTGIKAVDAMIPVGRGQREWLLVTVKQVNQLFVLILNQKEFYDAGNQFCIYVAIGQKRQL
jgi:F-type H+-transporting ATPase subunit alpha